jgi:hypothetical protein
MHFQNMAFILASEAPVKDRRLASIFNRILRLSTYNLIWF